VTTRTKFRDGRPAATTQAAHLPRATAGRPGIPVSPPTPADKLAAVKAATAQRKKGKHRG
jgi:hypothetical protein